MTVNFTLHPGSVTQTVEVSAAPPLLQTQSASTGQVVGSREINDLPLNGRNFTFLAQLSAGVTFSQADTRGLAASGSFAANGLRPAQNDYLLDGMDDNADIIDFRNGTAYVIRPPIDALQEFKVQTSDFSAQFGRAGGAVLNATLKSGTNQFHGDAWEFLRNSSLDAADFFENAAHERGGEYRQNQFGFTLGGPIRKNKTFFFMDYEGTRIRQATPYLVTVPTSAERASGFTNFTDLISGQTGTRTDLLGRTSPLGTIFDPATTRPVTKGQIDPVTGLMTTGTGYVRNPFPGNVIPASRLDPNAIKLLELYPLPNLPGIFNNYAADPVLSNDSDAFDTRIDQDFSDRDQMFGRYSFARTPQFFPGPFTGFADGSPNTPGSGLNRSQNVMLSETHTFSPSLINEARIGYSRMHDVRLQPFGNDLTNIPGQFGIQGVPQVAENGGLPELNIGSLHFIGSNTFLPSDKFSNTLQVMDDLTRVQGAHTIEAGIEYQHINFPWIAAAQSRGVFNYSGVFTSVVNQNDPSTGIAQFLLTPLSATVPNGLNNVGGMNSLQASNFINHDFSRNYFGAYGEDNWKATPKLTMGARHKSWSHAAAPSRRDSQ